MRWSAFGAVALGTCLGLAAAASAQENTMVSAMNADVKGMDPCNAEDIYCCGADANVYETLLQYSYLARPCKPEPCLADGMPQVSPDGLTYTFKLKKGVKFADDSCFKATGGKGRELVAGDVIYSWKRVADSRNHSFGWADFDGKVKGINAFHDASRKGDKTDYTMSIEGLQAPDPHTLVVKLTEPYPQFLFVVTQPDSAIVAREAVEAYGEEFLNHPVGTGPFKVTSWTRNSKIVFERNPGWRGETYPSQGAPGDKEAGLLADAGKPIPFLDKLEVDIITEDQPLWLKLIRGELDWGGIPKDNFDTAIDRKTKELKKDLADKGMRLLIEQAPDVTLTAFNMEDPVLGKNKLLREAMSLAYDNKRRIDLFYTGRAIPAVSPIPPGFFGYDSDRKDPWAGKDVAKAKELLAKAGFPDGKGLPEFTYENMADTTSRQFGEMFEREMEQLGITVKINANTWPEFNGKMRTKRAQIFGYGSTASYPDPEDPMSLFFGPNEAPGPNATNFHNARYDELYKKMRIMSDGPERKKLIDEMISILYDNPPCIWGVHRLNYRLAHKWLSNFKPHPFAYGMAKYYKVDPKLRAEMKKTF